MRYMNEDMTLQVGSVFHTHRKSGVGSQTYEVVSIKEGAYRLRLTDGFDGGPIKTFTSAQVSEMLSTTKTEA